MKLTKIAQCIALMGVAGCAIAQTAPAQKLQRVEITGSNIKRIQNEGALPIEVITSDDLQKKGITSVAEMLFELGANAAGADSAVSNNTVFGTDTDRLTGGSASANLRGFGPGSTLVLLNGRRVSTYGMSGGGVDINAIPMSAIARVEVLKDGASAIYGTDAVGGVINFITKTNFDGASVSVSTNRPLAGPAGTTRRAQVTVGKGSLESDRYSIVASFSVDKNDMLRGSDRDFSNGQNPAMGLSPNSSSSPFANVVAATGSALASTGSRVGNTDPTKYTQLNLLSIEGRCDAVNEGVQYQPQIWSGGALPSGRYRCNTDYGSQSMIAAPKEAKNLFVRGTLQTTERQQLFVELTGSQVDVLQELTGNQVYPNATVRASHAYPVSGPYYLPIMNALKAAGALDLDFTKPIQYRWRMDDFGNRQQTNGSSNSRILVGFTGDTDKYSYKGGFSVAKADASTDIIDGFSYSNKLSAALKSGIINPWVLPGQKQTPEAMALIESTKASGRTQYGSTTLTQLDGSLSGDLMNLPAGPLGFAIGFDVRKETYEFANLASQGGISCTTNLANPAPNEVFNCSGNSGVPLVSRNVKAVYAELAVPVAKGLDAQLAVRRDEYDGFGASVNPKIAIRYQPVQSFMLRGSVNTGFKAPSFQQQQPNNTPTIYSAVWTDGGKCPTNPAYCNTDQDFVYTSSGNPDLKPEISKQGTIGFVFAPLKNVSVYADYWRVDMSDRITKLSLGDLINPAYYDVFRDRLLRDANGDVALVRAGWVNASETSTKGIDWGASVSFAFDAGKLDTTIGGTRMLSHMESAIAGKPLQEYVGTFGARTLYLRDKFTANATWSQGDWRTTLSGTYKSGYADDDLKTFAGTLPAGANTDVDSYRIFSLFTNYKGFKNTTITVGLNNLLDVAPPFTHHDVDVASGAGWDPRVADPYGRTLVVNVKYDF